MDKLPQIKAAVNALPTEQKQQLLRYLAAQVARHAPDGSRLVRRNGDALLEAPDGAPPMTPQHVKQLLEDWP